MLADTGATSLLVPLLQTGRVDLNIRNNQGDLAIELVEEGRQRFCDDLERNQLNRSDKMNEEFILGLYERTFELLADAMEEDNKRAAAFVFAMENSPEQQRVPIEVVRHILGRQPRINASSENDFNN